MTLGSINLLERLTELRKPVYSLDCLFYYKRILKDRNQQPDEEIDRERSQTMEGLSLWSLGPGRVACRNILFP